MPTITFKGINAYTKTLKKTARKLDRSSVCAVVRANGAEMQTKAQRKAPYKTGDLRRSISLEMSDGGLTATVAPGVDYAEYQEYGTRFMAAHPYMQPALEEQGEIFFKDMEKLMK